MVVRVTDQPYDFSDLQDELKARGIDAYDVFKRCGSFDKWCNRKGYGKIDPEGKHRGSSQIWFAEYKVDPDGACKEPPHANLWHWFLNTFEKRRWIETSSSRHMDVIVTQKMIDQKAWVSALLAPVLARHGGKLKVRLSVSR